MKIPRIVLGLVVTLVLAGSVVVSVPVMGAPPTFTGNVETDFPTGPSVLTFVDSGGKDVLVPQHPVPGTSSGWDIKDVRLVYNSTTGILYVGLNSYETVGDADTNGNEGTKTYGPGVDNPDLGLGEWAAVYFDLDQDGNWDVIAGVPETGNYTSGFTIKNAIGTTPGLAFFGTTDLSAHLGAKYWTPATAPDLEFQILNFIGLPGQDGDLGAFRIGAGMGSSVDVDIIEDVLYGEVSPAINIVKTTNGSDGPEIPVGDPVTWTYSVTNTGSVNLTNIVVTDNQPGVTPVYSSGDDGSDGILEPYSLTGETWTYVATGVAIAGQYSNIGTATGSFDGFTVSDTDPSSYYNTPSRVVGGTAFPVNKLGLLAPWALLLGCAAVVTLLMLRKRRQA